MRRNLYSHSNPFEPSPKRRQVDTRPAGSSQSSRAGTIDQMLIKGSQQPRYSSSIPRDPPSTAEPVSSFREEDPQLDAFDLNLLAQDDGTEVFHEGPSGIPRVTPRQGQYVFNIEGKNAPQQRSRFFDPSPSVTPFRGVGSSPPDVTPGPPSSPLVLLRKRKERSWSTQGQLEPQCDPHPYDTSQSSPQLPSSHPTTELSTYGRRPPGTSPFGNIPLSVRGIVLVSVEELPDPYRPLFPFPLFNAIQSKCFQPIYNTNDNLVLAAPTGSGKTVVMELAICRLLNVLKDERFKVVYQAPTKSLCAERFRDWNSKFSGLNLKCAELTGDTDHTQLRNVQSSQIIITTPEKWDSMTRKWKDHMRLMQLVKLFLIDEVHILKETRGATLEAVVSRMKNIGSNVRFVALSATVPNSEDIATWLGKDATNQHVPAHREHFGEDFRPVKLQKFVYGYQSTANDFAFDKFCGSKLPDIIEMHSCQKPMMIFCCTRNSAVATAKELARLWTMTNPPARLWRNPDRRIEVHNEDLRTTIAAGVAFHHAGLGTSDRHAIERGFLDGHISVICCTSTLAVGVNLPCQLVIIKNTVGWQEGGCKEYSDLEMMQMLGRAGRPQFDDSATAVILTRKERVFHYEKLVSGSESLESCLHLNLIDHLNAEIGLGNVTDVESATKWLAGTFLFVRLRRNPTYYKLKEGASQADEDELLRQICEKDIKLLQECGLVETEKLRSTQFGDAMARYYIRFETMKILLSLKSQPTISQILDVIVHAEELRDIRLKAGEKSLYKELNRDPGIRYPIKVDIALPAHKISLLIQAELGAIEFPVDDQFQKHKFAFQQDKNLVLSRVNRLIRCVIDCEIAREDSIAILNSLELARSFGAKVWDRSPLQMKQIEQVGVVAVRKLAAAKISGIEDLECTEAHRIEVILSKNPPFGMKLLARLKEFPKLRVAVKMVGKDAKPGNVIIRFKLEVAFMNDKIPAFFQRRPVYVCCLTETSDGRLVYFRRISASKLQEGLEVTLTAKMNNAHDHIVCHAMCDDIAGTARQAEIKPDVSSHLFPPNQREETKGVNAGKPQTSTSGPRSQEFLRSEPRHNREVENFDGDDLQLDDFMAVTQRRDKPKVPSNLDDDPLDEVDWLSIDSSPGPHRQKPATIQTKGDEWITDMGQQDGEDLEPIRLPNGNWACNHKCKDKTSCKHFCCREGLEKPPKPSKKRAVPNEKTPGLNQLTLSATMTKRDTPGGSQKKSQTATTKSSGKEATSDLSGTNPSKLQARRKPSFQAQLRTKPGSKRTHSITEEKQPRSSPRISSSEFGDDSFDDLPPLSVLLGDIGSSFARPPSPMAGIVQPSDTGQDCIDPTKLSIGESSPNTDLPSSAQVDSAVEAKAAGEMSATQAIRPLQSPEYPEASEICDDLTPDSWKEIFTNPPEEFFTNPGGLKSSATSAPFAPSTANTTLDLKRKANTLDESPEEGSQNRLAPFSSREVLHEPVSISARDPVLGAKESRTSTTADSASFEWEDVDRGLLEEYGRFINFY